MYQHIAAFEEKLLYVDTFWLMQEKLLSSRTSSDADLGLLQHPRWSDL